jgi:tetratricopeptide (TPR) repeat protein
LTGYAQSWTNMYKQTCEATQIRHEQSPEVLDLRMSCLNERLNGFRALTDVFADASGEVVENAVSATNALSTLDRCNDVPTLRAVVKPPDDPATVARVEELRKRLAELKARFDAGQWKQTLKDAPSVIQQARTAGYQPLVAETLSLVGLMYSIANDTDASEKALVEAYRLADASRHDEVRAEVAATLVFVTGYQQRHVEVAHQWSDAASAVLQRLGGHDLLRAWYLNDLGCAYFASGLDDAGVATLKEGLALKQKLLGADHPDVGLSNGNLGYALERMGRSQEALSYVDRAIDIEGKKLGLQHPSLAMQFDNRGEILNALGRPEEARRSFEQAIAIWERELGRDEVTLASPLTGIGMSYLNEAKPLNAISPLERAIKIRVGREVDPVDQARTYFELARALWDAGREQGRARRLAEEAKAIYLKAAKGKELATVDIWLRDRRAS